MNNIRLILISFCNMIQLNPGAEIDCTRTCQTCVEVLSSERGIDQGFDRTTLYVVVLYKENVRILSQRMNVWLAFFNTQGPA